MNKEKGELFIFIAVTVYASMPILIRLLSQSVPPASMVFLRYIFAFLIAVVYATVKRVDVSKVRANILPLILVSIFGYGLVNLFYTYGIINTEIGNAMFIFFTFSIFTPVISYFSLKEKISRYTLLALVLASCSLFFLFQPNSFTTWKIGGFFTFLAALSQALYMIGRKKLKDVSSELFLVSNTFCGLIVVGLIAFLLEKDFLSGNNDGILTLTKNTWMYIALFGVLNFSGYYFTSKGLEYVKASTGSLLLLSEPLLALILAFSFLHEIPSMLTVIGGIFVLAASVIVIIKE